MPTGLSGVKDYEATAKLGIVNANHLIILVPIVIDKQSIYEYNLE